MTGLGIDMDPRQIKTLLSNPSGVADLLLEAHDETGDSPADIMADIINVQRADIKRLADAHGVDVEMNLMTPERAGELLAGTISGNGIELVLVFNELADKRAKILREEIGEAEYDEFEAKKHAIMNTKPEGSNE